MHTLRTWLTDNDCTQRDLAEDLGVHESAISQWLSGGTKPTLENLQKLAERTGIPVADLLADLTKAA